MHVGYCVFSPDINSKPNKHRAARVTNVFLQFMHKCSTNLSCKMTFLRGLHTKYATEEGRR